MDVNSILPSKVITFRRLVFQRSEGLVQSEALLTSEEASQETLDENERKKSNLSSRSKRRGSQRKNAGTDPWLWMFVEIDLLLRSSFCLKLIFGCSNSDFIFLFLNFDVYENLIRQVHICVQKSVRRRFPM